MLVFFIKSVLLIKTVKYVDISESIEALLYLDDKYKRMAIISSPNNAIASLHYNRGWWVVYAEVPYNADFDCYVVFGNVSMDALQQGIVARNHVQVISSSEVITSRIRALMSTNVNAANRCYEDAIRFCKDIVKHHEPLVIPDAYAQAYQNLQRQVLKEV